MHTTHTHAHVHTETHTHKQKHTHMDTHTHASAQTCTRTPFSRLVKLWTGSCGLFSSAYFTPVGQNGGTVTYTQTYTLRHAVTRTHSDTQTNVHTQTHTPKQTVQDEGKNSNQQQRSEGVKLPPSNFCYQASP